MPHRFEQFAFVPFTTGNLGYDLLGEYIERRRFHPQGIEFSADGKMILVTNEADENVSVHEIATGKLVKKIDTKQYGNRPRGIKMSPNGQLYVASLEYGNKLVVLDSQFNVLKVVSTGEVPYGLAFDRKGERLFVALAKGKALQVFDTAT